MDVIAKTEILLLFPEFICENVAYTKYFISLDEIYIQWAKYVAYYCKETHAKGPTKLEVTFKNRNSFLLL